VRQIEEGLDALTIETLKARYLREGERDWEDMCERVAKAIATTEEEYLEFKDLMVRKIFLPSSPTLMNAGTEFGQLAACFVIPVEDSIEEIFDSIKTAALIQKTGGGTGFDFSSIRPKGSINLFNDSVASGPVALMKLFNEATDIAKQFGRRRGANMGVLNVSHNDIISFIRAKQVEGELSNFNISVLVSDAFMEHIAANRIYEIWNQQTGMTVAAFFPRLLRGSGETANQEFFSMTVLTETTSRLSLEICLPLTLVEKSHFCPLNPVTLGV
jgi:ribonucleoside-diphosphate reductase alpha chain